jgi:RNA polymerase sigma-70 factor (ECF subfamily)
VHVSGDLVGVAGSPVPAPAAAVARRAPDAASARWVAALSASGRERDEAIARLHALLLRAARFEVGRQRSGRAPADADDLAMQAADDALVAVLRKLDTYRGDSRFTTWAYKFGLLEAGVKVRRRAWQHREVPLEDAGWERLRDAGASPDTDAQTAELLAAVAEGIAAALTPHQRAVLVAITLNGVPIDVLAQRLGSTRGALYKTLHDARKKLRARLAEAGLDPDGAGEGGVA